MMKSVIMLIFCQEDFDKAVAVAAAEAVVAVDCWPKRNEMFAAADAVDAVV